MIERRAACHVSLRTVIRRCQRSAHDGPLSTAIRTDDAGCRARSAAAGPPAPAPPRPPRRPMRRCSPAASFPTRSRSPCRAASAAGFALADTPRGAESATAGVVKDAGDDPDVTHGALVARHRARRRARQRRDLPRRRGRRHGDARRACRLPPGEPAINPVPRQMIARARRRGGGRHGAPATSTSRSRSRAARSWRGRTLERAPRHRRRPVDPRHHRHRHPVFAARPGSTRSTAASTSPARPG